MIISVWVLVYFMGINPDSDNGEYIQKDLGTFSSLEDCGKLRDNAINDGAEKKDLKCIGITILKDRLDSSPFILKNWW